MGNCSISISIALLMCSVGHLARCHPVVAYRLLHVTCVQLLVS